MLSLVSPVDHKQPKETIIKVRQSFRNLKKVDPGFQQLFNEYCPDTFQNSSKLLKDLHIVKLKLSQAKDSKQLHDLQDALERYTPRVFAAYWEGKSLKPKASFTEIKFPLISWCLQQAQQSEDKENARRNWSFCEKLLPSDFHQGLTFYEDKLTTFVRGHLNAKEKIYRFLPHLLKEAERVESLPKPLFGPSFKYLIEQIKEFDLKLSERYDSSFYREQIERFQKIASEMIGFDSLKDKMCELIKKMESLYIKSLDYEIATGKGIKWIEAVLSKIPIDLEKGGLPEKLIKELRTGWLHNHRGDKLILRFFLILSFWIEENRERLIDKGSALFAEKSVRVLGVLEELFLAPPKKEVKLEKPHSFENLASTMALFSDSVQANEMDQGANQAQAIVQMLKCFTPLDESQKQAVLAQCSDFIQTHEHLLSNPSREKSWQILKNALKFIEKPKFKAHQADSVSPPSKKFLQILSKLQKAFEKNRIGEVESICEEIKSAARNFTDEDFGKGREFCTSVKEGSAARFEHFKEDYAKRLATIITNIDELCLLLAETVRGEGSPSFQCLELMGDTCLELHEQGPLRIKSPVRILERAISCFEKTLVQIETAPLLFKLGSAYWEIGNEEAMIKSYDRACQLEPHNFVFLNRVSCQYFQMGRTDKQVALLREGVKHPFIEEGNDENSYAQIDLHRNLIGQLMHQKDFARAFPLLVNLKNHILKSEDYIIRDGIDECIYWLTLIPENISQFQADDYRGFLAQCHQLKTKIVCRVKIYESDPSEELKWIILADFAASLPRCEKMIIARVFSRSQNPSEAIALFKKIIRNNPFYFPAYFQLYQLYLSHGDKNGLDEIAKQILELQLPSFCLSDPLEKILSAVRNQEIDPAVYSIMANFFCQMQEFRIAEKLYIKSLEIIPQDYHARFGLACLFIKMGKLKEAEELFHIILRKSKRISHDDHYIGYLYFLTLYRMGNEEWRSREREWIQDHFTHFCEDSRRKLMSEMPDFLSEVYWKLAFLEKENSHSHLEKVLSLQPHRAEAHLEMGKLIFKIAPLNAVLCLQKAIYLNPLYYLECYARLPFYLKRSYNCQQGASVYRKIGEAFIMSGRIEEAIYNLETAAEIDPSSKTIHNLLGACYLDKKRFRAAILSYQAGGNNQDADIAMMKRENLFPFPRYGEYFRHSFEFIRGCLQELKMAEMKDMAICSFKGIEAISPAAKNKKQEILLQLQNLLNQCMQLFSTHLNQENLPSEFPVRNMEARLAPFDSAQSKSLWSDYKEADPSLFSFLKESYENGHKELERFIQQANREKHAEHAPQFLGSQTSITFDNRNKTTTTTVRPMFFDKETYQNPFEECGKIVNSIEFLIHNLLSHLSGRVTRVFLGRMLKDETKATQIWDDLIELGAIDMCGVIKSSSDQLDFKRFPGFEKPFLNYIRKLQENLAVVPHFDTYFDVEEKVLQRKSSVPKPLLDREKNLSVMAIQQLQNVPNLVNWESKSRAVQILNQWAKFHPKPDKNMIYLGDILWRDYRYLEALQAYRQGRQKDKTKEVFWEQRVARWGEAAFQIEETKRLVSCLEIAAEENSPVLNLHAMIVSKLAHSLDHALYAYCVKKFKLPQNRNPLLLKDLFFPIAPKGQSQEERVRQVFEFLTQMGKRIEESDPACFQFLCSLNPVQHEWLYILHEASNVYKHRFLLPCNEESKEDFVQNLQKRTPAFYRQAIMEIEKFHDKIAEFACA